MTFLAIAALRSGHGRIGRAPHPGQAGGQVEPIPGDAMFTIFIRGTDVGQEQVDLAGPARSGSSPPPAESATSPSTDSRSNAQPTGSPLRCTSKARRRETRRQRRAEEAPAIDVVRPDQRDQRDYAERRDQLEDRSDLRAQRSSCRPTFRRLRGARGTARQRQCRNRAPNLRGSAAKSG